MPTRHTRWRAVSLPLVLVLWCLWGFVPVASAEQTITSQAYQSVFDLKQYRDEGLTGKGVTIGLIDSPVDTTVPELAGAHITVKDGCHPTGTQSQPAHATAVASVLVSKAYGWAPDARLINYVSPLGDVNNFPVACRNNRSALVGAMLNAALNDGVDLVVITVIGSNEGSFDYAMARAALLGVPVVIGAGNSGDALTRTDEPAANGAVAVGATDGTGAAYSYSAHGRGLTVMAPGGPVTMREPGPTGKLTKVVTGQTGTSFAAPIVGGALALAMQKWPKATGNQLLRSLMATATGTSHHWTDRLGWGLLNVVDLVGEDPTKYPTTNPLLDKVPGGFPTPKEVADYRDGLTDPAELVNDPTYVYRGTDPYIIKDWKNSQPGTSPRYASASPASATAGPSASVSGSGSSSAPAVGQSSATASATGPASASSVPAGSPGATTSSGGRTLRLLIGLAVVLVLGLAGVLFTRSRPRS